MNHQNNNNNNDDDNNDNLGSSSSSSSSTSPSLPLFTSPEQPSVWNLSKRIEKVAFDCMERMNPVHHHLQAFNRFLDKWLIDLLEANNTLIAEDHKQKQKHIIRYSHFYFDRPKQEDGSPLFPIQARKRNMTYAVTVYAQRAVYEIVDQKTNIVLARAEHTSEMPPIVICDELPITVRSSACTLGYGNPLALLTEQTQDHGGYLNIRGTEYVVPPLDSRAPNRFLVLPEPEGGKYMHMVECRSIHESMQHDSTKTLVIKLGSECPKAKNQTGPRMDVIHTPFLNKKKDIPIRILFILLSWDLKTVIYWMRVLVAGRFWSDQMEHWLRRIWYSTSVDSTICSHVQTEDDAIQFMMDCSGRQKLEPRPGQSVEQAKREYIINKVVLEGILPHMVIHPEECRKHPSDTPELLERRWKDRKALGLCYMAWKLLMVALGKAGYDDPNDCGNKIYQVVGRLFPYMIRQHLRHTVDASSHQFQKFIDSRPSVRQQQQQQQQQQHSLSSTLSSASTSTATTSSIPIPLDIVTKVWGSGRLSQDIQNSITKGHLSGSKMPKRNGLVQVPKRDNPTSMINVLRRITVPLNKKGKAVKTRLLNPSQWGKLSITETSEGEQCGLVWFLALSTRITESSPADYLIGLLKSSTVLYDLDDFRSYTTMNHDIRSRNRTPGHPTNTTTNKSSDGDTSANCDGTSRNDYPNHYLMDWTRVFVNGRWAGWTDRPKEMIQRVRTYRSLGNVPQETSVYWNCPQITRGELDRPLHQTNDLFFHTDSGRITRPFIRADKLHVLASLKNPEQACWADYERLGIVEYIDGLEERMIQVAMGIDDYKSRTAFVPGSANDSGDRISHIVIHPAFALGYTSSMVPWADRNQSTRVIYQAQMGAQAMSCANEMERMSTNAHVLLYGEKPICFNRFADPLGINDVPFGVNCMVAIMAYLGKGPEDCLQISEGAVQRGLFHSLYLRTYREQQKRTGNPSKAELFEAPNPNNCVGLRVADYSKLGSNGLPHVGSVLKSNSVVIGKTVPSKKFNNNNINNNSNQPNDVMSIMMGMKKNKNSSSSSSTIQAPSNQFPQRRCASMILRKGQGGVVRKVIETRQGKTGKEIRKVTISTYCVPELCDKFSSRHGQKSTAHIIPECDMPVIMSSGICPDIITNPHGILSRMTMGHMTEGMAGRVGALEGSFMDGTPFTSEVTIEELNEKLRKHGKCPDGTEWMMSGITGELMRERAYVGIIYYQRLSHIVMKKWHARSEGPRQILTRQPTDGRAKEGGLRIGEMERDAFLAHGSSEIVQERMRIVSDNFSIYPCQLCGFLGFGNKELDLFYCSNCDRVDTGCELQTSYVFKLALQELEARHISIQIRTTLNQSPSQGQEEIQNPIQNQSQHQIPIQQIDGGSVTDIEKTIPYFSHARLTLMSNDTNGTEPREAKTTSTKSVSKPQCQGKIRTLRKRKINNNQRKQSELKSMIQKNIKTSLRAGAPSIMNSNRSKRKHVSFLDDHDDDYTKDNDNNMDKNKEDNGKDEQSDVLQQMLSNSQPEFLSCV